SRSESCSPSRCSRSRCSPSPAGSPSSGPESDWTTHDQSITIESMDADTIDVVRRARLHAALADPARLRIVDVLSLGDASPSELAELLAAPSNLVAHHLGVLEREGVVSRKRSEADRRRNYVQLVPGALEHLTPRVQRTVARVVFVCTRN